MAAEPRHAAPAGGAAVDGHELPELILVADFEFGSLPAVLQILGIASDGTVGMKHIPPAKACRPEQGGMRMHDAAFTELDLVPDIGVGADLDIGSQARARRNRGPRVDPGHALRSTILHIRIASAASSVLTVAVPDSLQKLPRQFRTLTSIRSWSPGTTGRRNRAPSMATKYNSLCSRSSTSCSSRTPPAWAMASMISTPGMTGLPGKCPTK